MRLRHAHLTYLAVTLGLGGTVAHPADWIAEPGLSRLGFIATYDGVAFEAQFRRFTASIHFDPDRSNEGAMEVSVDMASIDSNSVDRDEAMRGQEWLDSARFPTSHFVSTAVRQTGPQRFEALGHLTVKDIGQAIRVPFTWSRSAEGARLQGMTSLRRTDFQIGTGEWATDHTIGFDVKVVVDLRLAPAR